MGTLHILHSDDKDGVGIGASIEAHLHAYFAAHETSLPSSGLYGRVIQEVEEPLLRLALAACGGNQLRTAALLGLNRNTLRKKMRDLGLIEDHEKKRKNAARRRRL